MFALSAEENDRLGLCVASHFILVSSDSFLILSHFIIFNWFLCILLPVLLRFTAL